MDEPLIGNINILYTYHEHWKRIVIMPPPTNSYIIPLDSTTRFLATQLLENVKSPLSQPTVLLTPHFLREFLLCGSKITYENRISRNNPFKKNYHFKATSLSPFTDKGILASQLVDYRYPKSIILPATQLKSAFTYYKYFENIKPNTDIVIVNPRLGEVERWLNKLLPEIPKHFRTDRKNIPRIWTLMSTHIVENTPDWGVRHLRMGEVRICRVPFLGSNDGSFLKWVRKEELKLVHKAELAGIIGDITRNPGLNCIRDKYRDMYIIQLEQLIIDSCLLPLVGLVDVRLNEVMGLKSAENIVLQIIDECLKVVNRLHEVKVLRKIDPIVNVILNKQRILHLIMSLTRYSEYKVMSSGIDKQEFRSRLLEARIPSNVASTGDMDLMKANKYITILGERVGVPTPSNRLVCDMITSKKDLDNRINVIV